MELDCDSVGKPRPCEHGCIADRSNPRYGQCVELSPSQTCGTGSWPTTSATRQNLLCPDSMSYTGFSDLMSSSWRVGNQLNQVESDVSWYTNKLRADFYSPNENNTGVTVDSTTGALTVTLPASLAALATQAEIDLYQEFTCSRNLPKCAANTLVTVRGVGLFGLRPSAIR